MPKGRMAKNLIVIIVLVVALAAGCNSAVLGNLAVLVISIGIFLGTLSLGGKGSTTVSRAPDKSASSDYLTTPQASLEDRESKPKG